MFKMLIIYILAPIFLIGEKNKKEQLVLLKELGKTRKNFFPRLLRLLSELWLMLFEIVDLVWALSKGEKILEKLREEKQTVEETTAKCRTVGIPEWMIKRLVLDYKPPTSNNEVTS